MTLKGLETGIKEKLVKETKKGQLENEEWGLHTELEDSNDLIKQFQWNGYRSLIGSI